MTDLVVACADLAYLAARLPGALARDSSAGGGRAPSPVPASPVNTDVEHAMFVLRTQVPAETARAAWLAGERWPPRPAGTCLRALPRFHGRLESLGLAGGARRLEGAVAGWTRLVKLALGLRRPDMPIGFDCPLHAERSPLVCVGSERFPRPDGPPAEHHSGVIWCAACGASWDASRWAYLGRLLRHEMREAS